MMHKVQFDNEIEQRKLTNPKHVVEVICTSADDTLKDIWVGELRKLGKWSEYKYGIVMVSLFSGSTTKLTPFAPP